MVAVIGSTQILKRKQACSIASIGWQSLIVSKRQHKENQYQNKEWCGNWWFTNQDMTYLPLQASSIAPCMTTGSSETRAYALASAKVGWNDRLRDKQSPVISCVYHNCCFFDYFNKQFCTLVMCKPINT